MVIKELKIYERNTIALLVENATMLNTSNGDLYQKLVVKDSDGEKINVNFFNIAGGKKAIVGKSIIDAVLECGEYNGVKTYTLKDWTLNNQLTSDDFKPKAGINQTEVWNKIIGMIKKISDKPLCQLCCKVLTNDMKKFKTSPLTASDAYARVSGLMEATYKLMTLAETTSIAMELDKDLMLAASSIYYIGSVDMVDDDYMPTREVALIGYDISAHDKLVRANMMLKEEDRVDLESFQILENCLLSRWQGKPTATAEAFALRELDSIVAVVDLGNKLLSGIDEGSFVEDRPFNRKWYKKTSREEYTALEKEVV